MEIPKNKLELLFITLTKKHKAKKKAYKRVTKERNKLRVKLKRLEQYVDEIEYYYDKYDDVSLADRSRLVGKVELKEEILKILAEE